MSRAPVPLSAGSYVWVNSQGISKESNYFSVSDIFFEAECNPLQLSFDEAQEGISAFSEKRMPNWVD